MKRSIPSVLRLTAMASPWAMMTESSLMTSSISYEHIHRYSIRSSHLRLGGIAPIDSLPEVCSNSLFPPCCSRNETAVQWESIASRVCVAMTKPPATLREMLSLGSFYGMDGSKHRTSQEGKLTPLIEGVPGYCAPIYLGGKYLRRKTSSLFKISICMHLILQGYFSSSPWHTLQRYSFTRLVITTMNDWRHHRVLCVVRAITLRPSQATRYVQS
jgi:hypothetical protein